MKKKLHSKDGTLAPPDKTHSIPPTGMLPPKEVGATLAPVALPPNLRPATTPVPTRPKLPTKGDQARGLQNLIHKAKGKTDKD